jgi:putative copper export protein
VRADGSDWIPVLRQALPRFSLAGYFAVSLILLSGCVIGWLLVQNLNQLVDTPYGRVLLAKVSLFFLMVGIALVNRLVLSPPIGAGSVVPIVRLSRNIAAEQAVGLTILLLASCLAALPPPHAH